MDDLTQKIYVVSNTHWDREFRFSFEKTRYKLAKMLDTVIDILERDPEYHSFTLDGHSLLIEDYLEIRPENKERVHKLISNGRLIIGPYYTLAEQFSISHEALVRNLIYGRKLMRKYDAKEVSVAYTPSSWGQTGQYPQILSDFGIKYMMFYRGISHDEAPAEYIWEAPDGTSLMASRFALYCRYNWYYQVHRAVTRHKVFNKEYIWGEQDEAPYRRADIEKDEGVGYDLKSPVANYDKSVLKKSIEDMLEEEKGHFTTPIFLAMNGHDISCAYPLESKIIKDANEIFDGKYEIVHTDLEHFWKDAGEYLNPNDMVHLKGERRSYLKKGKWTYLMPSTISARTNMKQLDFKAYTELVYIAEPISQIAGNLCKDIKHDVYLDSAWRTLLSNHTHDANGGGAVDDVCADMRYRYKNVCDIASILTEDSTSLITSNFIPDTDEKALRLTVFNTLSFTRDVTAEIELLLPEEYQSYVLDGADVQILSSESDSTFVDSIWEVPTILDVTKQKVVVNVKNVPALGYRSIKFLKGHNDDKIENIVKDRCLENDYLKAQVNPNGTVDVFDKQSEVWYKGLNYLSSSAEMGNAWIHRAPENDEVFTSQNCSANITIAENGNLRGCIRAEYDFNVPIDCINERSSKLCSIPVTVDYILERDSKELKVKILLDNTAKDHWLRANFPTDVKTKYSYSDSHFDIVRRAVEVPDSSDWVETAYGMQPLRTFAAVNENDRGFAIMPKGLYEYEVFEDERSTLALTLIRACRIKLQVSEEKITELPDNEMQCGGVHTYEFAVKVGDFDVETLPNIAAHYFTKAIFTVSGRGKGNLPLEYSMLSLDNNKLHVTAIKRAENGKGTVVRFYNPTQKTQNTNIKIGFPYNSVYHAKMDETIIEKINANITVEPKKIFTLIVD